MIRFFDILFSIIGLILLLPFFIVLAIWIKIDSKGPILYKQNRVGKDNIDFELYKFRTMFINADCKGLLLTIGNKDPRITKSGFFLRKYKIDEIPQLFNVIKGEMSFVGPRPEVRKYVETYTQDQRKVLSVRPGITDYASIEFADESNFLAQSSDPEQTYINEIIPKKINLNMKFINNKTLKEYFTIILLTICKIYK